MHRKLRSAIAVLALVAAMLAPAAVANAKVTVSGYPVSPALAPGTTAGGSAIEPAITPAPDGSDAEWFVVSGQGQSLLSITPAGEQAVVARGLASDAGSPDNYASVAADGYDWVLDNDQGPGNVLYAVGPPDSPSPGLNPVARFGDYGQDITLGPDGALYVADNDGIIRCQITDAPSATCVTAAIPPPFYTGAGAFAIAGASDGVWFTDGANNVGAYASGSFIGPYSATGGAVGSTDPGTVVAAANRYIYAAGASASSSGVNTEILAFSLTKPGLPRVVASGLGNVGSMTIGPDGNVWFLDAGGSGSVGMLNITTNGLTRYALPQGLRLPQSGWRIASGPQVPSATGTGNGTGELFFTGTATGTGSGSGAGTAAGIASAEIGVVSGIPFPVEPGALGFRSAISVSRHRLAVLTLRCTGGSNAACSGKILLSVRTRLRVRVVVRAARRDGSTRFRIVTRASRLSLGAISYRVHGGASSRFAVRLSSAAYRLLEKVVGHRWTATVTSAATLGTVSGSKLTMIGPAPPRPGKAKQTKN